MDARAKVKLASIVRAFKKVVINVERKPAGESDSDNVEDLGMLDSEIAQLFNLYNEDGNFECIGKKSDYFIQ